MKKFHIALGVSNIEESVRDYSLRLGQEADLVIPGEYAIWRTQTLNVSIRRVPLEDSAKLRHLGWENPEAKAFTTTLDCNGLFWEEFSAPSTGLRNRENWPGADFHLVLKETTGLFLLNINPK